MAAKATRDERWDSLWINAYACLLTAVLVLPLLGAGSAAMTTRGWLSCWYMAVFPTAIGHTLYYVGVQRKGPAWAATSIYLVPSFAVALALTQDWRTREGWGSRVGPKLPGGLTPSSCVVVR